MTDRELLELLLNNVTEIKSDITALKSQFGNVNDRLENVENRLNNVEGQLCETNQIVKALLHRSEETDAKLEGLAVNTASQTSVERIEKAIDRIAGDISFLARKAIEHDDDIRALRRAK